MTSRRKAEELMVAGRVFLNGKKVTKLGTTVTPGVDEVMIDDEPVPFVTTFRYIALNKPAGVICTRAVHPKERTVYHLVPESRDLVIAGRLDKDSSGLVILTNDGELTNKLTHPRYQHEKEYEVITGKPLDAEAVAKLRQGIRLVEGKAMFDRIEEIEPRKYRVIIHQGWKRQIRRMIGFTHNDVVRLTRVRINKLLLGDLQPSAWRKIERSEII